MKTTRPISNSRDLVECLDCRHPLKILTHPGGLPADLDLSDRRATWKWLRAHEPPPACPRQDT